MGEEAGSLDEVVFGRYRLRTLIGQGGMGNVYRAHGTVIGRNVANKMLPPRAGRRPGVIGSDFGVRPSPRPG